MNEWWDRPVRVMIGNRIACNVNNNEQAARMLLGDEWPDKASARYKRANATILRSMERPDDPGTLYAAQLAFEAAAREADVLVER